ncbi:MAG: zinc metalloprotease HtpX [Acidobacteriia bacterium]|nr:zinc metalloprotease HtpX [Terriglobia bacterium]
MNGVKTVLLLGLLTGLLLFVGETLGGQNGMMLALVIAVVMNFASYFWSDKIALAMNGAKPISREDAPMVYRICERLTANNHLPMPKIYAIPTDSPNAFATGRNPEHASVAFTTGILKILDEQELEGVIAHELSHVKNRDILISAVAATIAGALTMVARMAYWAELFGGFGGRSSDDERGGGIFSGLLMIIVAPIAAMLIQLAISRSREYQADASGAEMTHNPYGLANALQKLDVYSKRLPMQASPSTAHMFIVQPFTGRGLMNAVGNLFSTHPPIAKRIERLTGRKME